MSSYTTYVHVPFALSLGILLRSSTVIEYDKIRLNCVRVKISLCMETETAPLADPYKIKF